MAQTKITVFLGLDNGYLMPACMSLTDIFGALIGIALTYNIGTPFCLDEMKKGIKITSSKSYLAFLNFFFRKIYRPK